MKKENIMGKETAFIGSRTGARRFSPGRLRQHGYSCSNGGDNG